MASLLINPSIHFSRFTETSLNDKKSFIHSIHPKLSFSCNSYPSNQIKVKLRQASSIKSTVNRFSKSNRSISNSLNSWNGMTGYFPFQSNDGLFYQPNLNSKKPKLRKNICYSSLDNTNEDMFNDERMEEVKQIKKEMDDVMKEMYSQYEKTNNEEEKQSLDSLKSLLEVKIKSMQDLLNADEELTNMFNGVDFSKLNKSTDDVNANEDVSNLEKIKNDFLNDEGMQNNILELEKLTEEIQSAMKNFSDADFSTEKIFSAQKNFFSEMEDTEKKFLAVEKILKEMEGMEEKIQKNFENNNEISNKKTIEIGDNNNNNNNNDNNDNNNNNVNEVVSKKDGLDEEDVIDLGVGKNEKIENELDKFVNLNENNGQTVKLFENFEQIRNLRASDSIVHISKEEMTELKGEADELKTELQELADEIMHLWREGENEDALSLLNENLLPLQEQCSKEAEGEEAGIPQAAMLSTLTQVYFWMGKDDEAVQLLNQTVDLVNEIPDGLPLLDEILENLGDIFFAANNLSLSVSFYLRSIANQQIMADGVTVEQTSTMTSLSRALYGMKLVDDAINVQKEIIDIQTRVLGEEDPTVAFSSISLSQMLIDFQKFDDAEDACQKAIKILNHNQISSLNMAIAYCTLSNVKEARGQIEDAIVFLKKGISIMEENENIYPENEVFIASRTSLAQIYDQCGRSKEAQAQWLEILLASENVLGSDHADLINPLLAYANSLILTQDFEQALPLCSRAYELASENAPSSQHPSLIFPLQRLSLCHYKTKNVESAESYARQALNICESLQDDADGLMIGECCSQLAAILHAQGRDMEAEPLLWRTLKNEEEFYGQQTPQIIPTLEALIVVLHGLKKVDEIRPLAQRLNVIRSSSSFA